MRKLSIMILSIFLLISININIYSQSSAGGSKGGQNYTLIINTNPSNASIFINGTQQKGNQFNLPPGKYTIEVKANGYTDFTTTINLTQNMTITATLQPSTFSLNVRASVQGAQIFINNSPRGNTNFTGRFPAGNYTIQVRMPGYQDFNTSVTLNKDTVINATLIPITHTLTIRSNIPGAQVYINKIPQGQTNYTGVFSPGIYSIQVSMPGYQDYTTNVNLTQNTVIDANLLPLMATLNIVVPPNILEPRVPGAINQVKVFIDGRPAGLGTTQLPAGNHQIRITSGGLWTEQMYNFQPGVTYTITLSYGMIIQQ